MGRMQPIRLCKPCNAHACPQQGWKSCANRSNIVALRFGDHGRKEIFCWLKSLTGFKLRSTTPNITQRHATTCNRVCKRTQHVTSNVGSCWPTTLRPFARRLMTLLISSFNSTFVEGDVFIYYLLVLLLYVKNQINSRGYNESACMVIL